MNGRVPISDPRKRERVRNIFKKKEDKERVLIKREVGGGMRKKELERDGKEGENGKREGKEEDKPRLW